MEETPEGFLLIRDVAIARCGTQLYRHNEVPMLEADEAGWLRIDREPQEVFHTDTLASYEGKPLVNDHPTSRSRPPTGPTWPSATSPTSGAAATPTTTCCSPTFWSPPTRASG
jgi:hypothetical protein